MTVPAFPMLANLMNAYFNQDYDLHGSSDEDVLDAYIVHSSPTDVAATAREIDALLAMPVEGLNDRFRRDTGEWNMTIGESDAEARAWLEAAHRQMIAALDERPGQA